MKSLVVTGASGWMGRSAIASWLRGGNSPESVRVITRRSSPLEFMGHKIKKFSPLDSIKMQRPTTLVHSAFATRELYDQLGPKEFELANREIIQNAEDITAALKPQNVIFLNSGVTQKAPARRYKDPSYEAYARMKGEERDVILRSAEKVGASVVEGVLFSSSGRFMKNPLQFAFGSLVNQALLTDSLIIKSKGNVWRRYCDSEEFFDVLFYLSSERNSVSLESGGYLIELGHLAHELELYFGRPVAIQRELDPTVPDDFYFSTSNDYEIALMEAGINRVSLQHQIGNVISALKLWH